MVFQWFYTLSPLIRFDVFGFEEALFSEKLYEVQWCGQCYSLKYDLKSNCFLLLFNENCTTNFCRKFWEQLCLPMCL